MPLPLQATSNYSILIKSCSARDCSDLLPKELQNKPPQKSRHKAIHTLMYFKLDESLAHSSLNFLLELAMKLQKYI